MLPGFLDWLAGLPPWLGVTVLVTASFAAAVFVNEVGLRAVRRLTRRTGTTADDVLLRELRVPIPVTVAVAGAFLAPSVVPVADSTALVLRASALTAAALVWARTLARLGTHGLRAYDARTDESADFAPIFQNLWTFVVLAATAFVVLTVWEIEVTPLLASAGIAGIAIGFAAKDTVANFFGSISLYVDGTYAVGDYVELDTGVAGTVQDISIRSTRILTRDNVIVTVPNAVLNSAQLTNHSAPVGKTRVKVPVGVAYGSDVDAVEDCLIAAASAVESVARNPSPRARFRGFGDSALDYELLVWVPSPLHDGRATHELNRDIYARFDAAGIEIPFPQREVRVLDDATRAGTIAATEESRRGDAA
ncbi:mechanosensitive ion channel family protein [Salarchaeum japonicum]|uniref:mechanosensitive ion channel family protein n=1 Tax=Salarchaeum japonicum TaxID=555573 RepID=UPI003C72B3C5